MAGEPMSTRDQPSVPDAAAEQLNLAERFSSFAEYAVSTASLPQTAATSLDVARFHAFTGELTFSVDPAVRLYLDGGSVYHAERDGGPTVSRILLDAAVIDSVQLQRGVVSVGGVDHLGRLFDRDTTVDRDAVMVVMEGATGALLEEIANAVIATVSVTAYRHHPSGIHRWFVAPVESTGVQRPASGVMQIDRSVVEDLPRLGETPEDRDVPAPEDVTIEWSDPEPSGGDPSEATDTDRDSEIDGDIDIDIQAELDRFDADRADWAARSESAAGARSDSHDAEASSLDEFHVVWPDGTRDASIMATETEASSGPVADDTASGIDDGVPPTALAMPTGQPVPVDLPPPGAPATGASGFTIEPLRVDQIPAPDASVPDDVATAVRRALQAIENASSRSPVVPVPELHVASDPSVAPQPAPSSLDEVVPAPPPSASSPVSPLGFAPPTLDMRAEAVYERAAAAPADADTAADSIVGQLETIQPAPDEAPVIVDDDSNDEAAKDRRGALRRLIGSLRNKD